MTGIVLSVTAGTVAAGCAVLIGSTAVHAGSGNLTTTTGTLTVTFLALLTASSATLGQYAYAAAPLALASPLSTSANAGGAVAMSWTLTGHAPAQDPAQALVVLAAGLAACLSLFATVKAAQHPAHALSERT